MILAETIASEINWSLIASLVMAVFTALLWWDGRKNKSVRVDGQISGTPPGNDILARDLKAMNHRVRTLEDWRQQLIAKLDDDKSEVIEAGEERARRIYAHVDEVRRELSASIDKKHSENSKRIDDLPDKIISTLKNAGAI